MRRIFITSIMSLLAFGLIGCGDLINSTEGNITQTIEENREDNTIVETNNSSSSDETIQLLTKEQLGEALFSDKSLSFNRNISCASCHEPSQAFVDIRSNGVDGAVSLGDDNISLGDRNSQMISYISFSPAFSTDANGSIGGLFWDGRAVDLVEQAKGPFLNEVEMQMSDVSSVIDRIKESANYIINFQNLYGESIFDSDDDAFNALADAIASFEKSDIFAPFNAKIDKVRQRLATLTDEELLGQTLFRTKGCVTCHDDRGDNALFTTFRYENIGVPKNTLVRELNGKGEAFIDHGLLDNPNISTPREDGKFKIPSLRNVAITAPYMHNGKFKNLKTVIHFYNTRDVVGAINPETSLPWEESEVLQTRVRVDKIGDLNMSDSDEDALVAFLKTLTDEAYENLLQ